MARLSVIVTSYNIEDYLGKCLDTILGQTLSDLEVIVVDDGSSDASPDIIRARADQDDRVVPVLLADNSIGGVATAANAGLDRATGDYVGFADGDDFYELDMFEKLVAAAMANDADLAMCNYQLFDDDTGESSDPADSARWSRVRAGHHELDVAARKQFLRFIAVPWRKIYRRSMLEDNDIRFPVGDHYFEDNPFHWFSLLTADSMTVVPEVLCHHRVARAGQTMDTADARLYRIFDHHDTILAWLTEHDLRDTYGPNLLEWAIAQMEWISERTPPHLREALFTILRQVFTQHDDDTLERALNEGHRGMRARQLAKAVHADSLATFNRVLDDRSTAPNPLVSAMYHLKYSGLSETAEMTRRYATQKLAGSGSKLKQGASRLLPDPPTVDRAHKVSNDDIMFALMVMQRRLEAMEHRLEQLADED